jgi:hypothetical protein
VEEVKRFFLASGLFCFSSIAFSQVVCVGTAEQCRESQKKICANEKAEANLDLAGAKHLQGVVKDQTGPPFNSSGNYEVQLRDATSGRVLQRTSLEFEGRFTFANLNGGTFRLIVVRLVAGVAQRTGFDQPSKLQCENTEDCKLSIVLRIGPSDQPVDSCPPK